MIVYFNGDFIPKEEVAFSPDDRGLLFADGVYEVVRSYEGRLFKMQEHMNRLDRSLRELRIEMPDTGLFVDVCARLLEENGLARGDAVVYMQVTRGVAPRMHAFPKEPTAPTVYATPAPFEVVPEKWENGVKVILAPDTRWARCDIKSLALLPNVLASQRAAECGVEEAILVRDGAVTEGSHTSFCAVFDGQVVTSPLSNYILPGITRQVALDLCVDLGIPVVQFPIAEARLKDAEEMMLLGTGSEVMPVVQVDDWQVGDGRPGPVTGRLLAAYRKLYS